MPRGSGGLTRLTPHRAKRGWLALFGVSLFTFVLSGVPAAAHGDQPPVQLAWEDEGERTRLGCVDATTLGERVERVLGKRVFSAAAPVSLSLRAEASPDGFIVTLTLAHADEVLGVRSVEKDGASCDVLTGPLVVVTAMLVDLQLPVVQLDLRDEPPTEDAPTEAPPSSRPVWELGIWLGPSASWSLLPDWAGGVSIGAWVAPPAIWPIELALDFYPGATVTNDDDRGGDFLAFVSSLMLCPPVAGPNWRLRICGGVGAGLIRGAGTGFGTDREEVVGHLDARLLLHFEVRIVGALWLFVRGGAAVPLIRTEFVGESGGTRGIIHESGAVIPLGSLGLAVQFF